VYAKAPHYKAEKEQAKKMNEAIDNCLSTPWQPHNKELDLNMPPKYKRHGGAKRYCHCLGKHDYIDGAEYRPDEELGSDDINARDRHYRQERGNSHPLKPATYQTDTLLKSVQHY